MTNSPIIMSVFELLKAGPGPSSSHTIGPMKAGADFVARVKNLNQELCQKARGLRVRLLGSLSATGQGHGTDRAVLAGLMGYEPASCPPALLNEFPALPQSERLFKAGSLTLPLGLEIIEYGPVLHEYPYSNTLFIDLLDRPYPFESPAEEGEILFSMEYYSVGGGFLQWKGWQPEERGKPAHPYGNLKELHQRLAESGLSLDRLLLENETAITGAATNSIKHELDRLLELMMDTVRRGCEASGRLPGTIGLYRKAGRLFEKAPLMYEFDRNLALLNAYAYGAAEENAAGNIIVTAPTCGAAGVVPAITMFMRNQLSLGFESLRRGLLAAAMVGFIAKQNAGIAGAEVGCQGEIGVASSMGAAMMAYGRGYDLRIVENAAEIALEHHLGLTCDPVGGYVQIPCIERNAVGAVKAYNAALIACNEDPANHKVSYDETLKAMAEIGCDMCSKYKETSTGGLAVCLAEC